MADSIAGVTSTLFQSTTVAAEDVAGLYYLRTKEVKKVYLAGPITGWTYGDCTDWRQYAKQKLGAAGIEGISPMRGKEYLAKVAAATPLSGDCDVYKEISVLSSNRGVMTRDRWDATRCDLMLINFLGSKFASIGTLFEMAWADSKRIPTVVVVEDGNIHWEHAFVKEATGFRLDNLDKALELVEAICQ